MTFKKMQFLSLIKKIILKGQRLKKKEYMINSATYLREDKE